MIRFANKQDIPAIMEFIDINWKKGHILGTDRDFFEYEFVNGDSVNVVISLDLNNKINGMEGFIPYGSKNRDICPVMWKVINSNEPMLGVRIMKFMVDNADARIVMGSGINKRVSAIYKHLGYKIGQLSHWFRLNAVDKYRIAKVTNPFIPNDMVQGDYSLVQIENADALKDLFDFEKYYSTNPKPLKEEWYIEKRYFNHPIYKYDVYGICNGTKSADTLVVFRIQECNGAKALRCVDVIGCHENFYCITGSIDQMLDKYHAEYVDFYEAGLIDAEMERAGWLKVKTSGNIIPNYFYPYVCENIDIDYYSPMDEQVVVFKGDGDQDRPN